MDPQPGSENKQKPKTNRSCHRYASLARRPEGLRKAGRSPRSPPCGGPRPATRDNMIPNLVVQYDRTPTGAPGKRPASRETEIAAKQGPWPPDELGNPTFFAKWHQGCPTLVVAGSSMLPGGDALPQKPSPQGGFEPWLASCRMLTDFLLVGSRPRPPTCSPSLKIPPLKGLARSSSCFCLALFGSWIS